MRLVSILTVIDSMEGWHNVLSEDKKLLQLNFLKFKDFCALDHKPHFAPFSFNIGEQHSRGGCTARPVTQQTGLYC